jgi:microcystin-dependent protein
MSDQFIGEIRMFAGNFAPVGWAFCSGQVLAISQFAVLFSLLGTTYGGNGTTNFALPNLQGAAPMAPGQGPGLSNHDLGEKAGSSTVTLTAPENAAHSHALQGSSALATSGAPQSAVYAEGTRFAQPSGPLWPYSSQAPDTSLNPGAILPAGGNQPHNNLMPYLTLSFIIALQGIVPPRG